MANTQRISMWASPRNISTAMMYSFAQRDDCQVFDEPLYGYYLHYSDAKEYHPGADEIMKSLPIEEKEAIDFLMQNIEAPMAFFKNMSHHLLDMSLDFFKEMRHFILTRHPHDMLLSFSKVISQPKMSDVGYESQIKVLRQLQKNNLPIAVIDSKNILENPTKELQKLCDFLEISFDEKMLNWVAGPRKEDGVWAPYWYKNVHQSTGFGNYQKSNKELPEELNTLYEKCLMYYEELQNYLL